MPGVQYRQARPEDAVGVLAVKRAAIQELAGWHYDAAQIDAWAPDVHALPAFETALEDDRFTVRIALLDDEPVGYGVLDVDAGRVEALYVDPDHTGEAIATTLLGQLEMGARLHGIDELTLVASQNARGFYESVGYEATGTVTREIEAVELEFVRLTRSLDESVAE